MTFVEVPSLAALLGVRPRRDRSLDSLDLSSEVDRGLSVATVDRLCRLISPDDPNLVYRIVPKATLARRRRGSGRLNSEESNRLARLAQVWAVAMDVWKTEDSARRFLSKPHPLLRNRTPRELAIESDIGARAVENMLGGIKYGIPV